MISMSYKSWSIQFSQEQKVLILEKKSKENQKSFSSEWAQTNSYKQLFSFRTWQYDLRFIQITSCITNIQHLD